jgi:hypothetical protein
VGTSVEYVGLADRHEHPREWSVAFDVYSPDGNLIDGPVVVIIDKDTMKARFFDSPSPLKMTYDSGSAGRSPGGSEGQLPLVRCR